MVVEHEFVTTLDGQTALSSAASFLSEGGFSGEGSAFVVGQTEWTTLEMKRGNTSAARAKSISDLPQRIIVTYDRGRVTIAASITASQAWGGGSTFRIGFGSDDVNESKKKMVLHQQLLVGIANGLERALVLGQDANTARADWLASEQVIAQAARKRKRKTLITAAFVVFVFVATIAAILIASSR